MTKMQQLADLGQSVWYDYIQRSLLDSGEFQKMVDDGLRGVTSNPAIFEKAITGSSDYDAALKAFADKASDVNALYEHLVLDDIAKAADLFRPVYDTTNGLDGYVSIEVNPLLAYDTNKTVEEAVRLFNQLGRPNIMIKVPATKEGIPAISELIQLGINVNVTLIFGLDHYRDTAKAFIDGLEKFHQQKGDVSKVASVASFFVSRVDTAVDKALEDKGVSQLLGKIAIANSKAAYAESLELFDAPRWQALARDGARQQRLLWASTGAKNPAYSDTLYVDELIGADTVNTMPPATLTAFLDHGRLSRTIDKDVDQALADLNELAQHDINLQSITDTLQRDGVELFKNAFLQLMDAIEQKSKNVT